ncbi:hypothetical protein NDU88_003909 [Pleurodeles waltl]|uniref:Uncharacterized protein n=1 Tax=Pleurodeles waltl TaxID=8319 RepID=A0AAV7W6L3_PLEWA|nr:hypothetical protein NDU88_003909 [Pleurodeles waltl]
MVGGNKTEIDKGQGHTLIEGTKGSPTLVGGADQEQEEVVFGAALPRPFKESAGYQPLMPVQKQTVTGEDPVAEICPNKTRIQNQLYCQETTGRTLRPATPQEEHGSHTYMASYYSSSEGSDNPKFVEMFLATLEDKYKLRERQERAYPKMPYSPQNRGL